METEKQEKRVWNKEEAELETQQAADELMDIMRSLGPDSTVVSQIADLWRRHYQKAGHKRLGRMLMAIK